MVRASRVARRTEPVAEATDRTAGVSVVLHLLRIEDSLKRLRHALLWVCVLGTSYGHMLSEHLALRLRQVARLALGDWVLLLGL